MKPLFIWKLGFVYESIGLRLSSPGVSAVELNVFAFK